jgi:uncharacterized protein YeaO (DUF488 family)
LCERRTTALAKSHVRVRRIYDELLPDDGARVLVDRLWPRGVTKQRAKLDDWCKEIAPSPELRKWYGHDPGLYEEFRRRYRTELRSPDRKEALNRLSAIARQGHLTLLTATKDPTISEAAVLAELLSR